MQPLVHLLLTYIFIIILFSLGVSLIFMTTLTFLDFFILSFQTNICQICHFLSVCSYNFWTTQINSFQMVYHTWV